MITALLENCWPKTHASKGTASSTGTPASISECERRFFNEVKDIGEARGIMGMQVLTVGDHTLFLRPSARRSSNWYRVGTAFNLSLTILEWTHALPGNNQASKAAYTEEAASRQGYGGSCYTPLVRDAAPSDGDNVGLSVAVTYSYKSRQQWRESSPFGPKRQQFCGPERTGDSPGCSERGTAAAHGVVGRTKHYRHQLRRTLFLYCPHMLSASIEHRATRSRCFGNIFVLYC